MPLLIPILFLLMLDWLAFQPFQLLAQDWSPLAQNLLYGGYWTISALCIFTIALIASGRWTREELRSYALYLSLLTILYFSKFFMLVFLFVQSVFVFIVDAISAFVDVDLLAVFPDKTGAIATILMGLLPLGLLTYGMIRNVYRYKVHRIKVPIDGLPPALNGLKIVQISDIHAGSFREVAPINEALRLINNEKADLVFFTGDIVNNVAEELIPFTEVFSQIEAKHGVYSILGNHDYGDYVRWNNIEEKRSNLKRLIDLQKGMGWDLLLNEHRILNINGEKVAVIGVENFSGNPRFTKYGDLRKAYQNIVPNALELLLSHDPSHWNYEVNSEYPNIDITFSGHTHGGQFGIEIGDWLKWSPVKYAYREWAGLYQSRQQYLYVNRGFGVLAYPGRIGILPEITVMELQAKDHK